MRWRQRRVYLDVAAGITGNPSSPHAEGRAARERLERARREVAQLVEAQADDVIFTSGATEGNALAILGVTRAAREAGRAAHVLYQPGAHASITENVKRAAREGAVVEALPLRDGRVDTDALAAMLRPETVLVAMEAVCGETGVVWNTREVAQILKKELRAPRSNLENPDLRFDLGARALLLVDASQAPLTEKITRDHFGADLLVFDGAKVAPMHGVGALVAHRTIPLVSLYDGGGQERGVRPGTASPELAARFAAALRAAANGREPFRARASRAREHLLATLTHALPAGSFVINESRDQAPNIVNLSFPSRDTDYLVALLDEAGFAVSTKSACETDSETGSRAVFALTGDRERAKATLRISWGPETRERDLLALVPAVARALPLA